jgi:hypothetical protein
MGAEVSAEVDWDDSIFSSFENLDSIVPVVISDFEAKNADSDYDPDRNIKEEAEKLGLVAVIPVAGLLMLDLDSSEAVEDFEQRLEFLKKLNPRFVERVTYTTSKSGNKHAYVELAWGTEEIEALAWQAALGSDPFRAILDLHRLDKHIEGSSVLFETPQEYERLKLLEVIS